MFKKGEKMYAIVHHKCPRCHEGDLWTNKLWFEGAKARLHIILERANRTIGVHTVIHSS